MTDRDKLWAFLALLGSIVCLALVTILASHFTPPLPSEAYKVSDSAMTILGTAFGAAALALFRTSQSTNDMVSIIKTQGEQIAAASPTAPVTVLQPGDRAQAAQVPPLVDGAS